MRVCGTVGVLKDAGWERGKVKGVRGRGVGVVVSRVRCVVVIGVGLWGAVRVVLVCTGWVVRLCAVGVVLCGTVWVVLCGTVWVVLCGTVWLVLSRTVWVVLCLSLLYIFGPT